MPNPSENPEFQPKAEVTASWQCPRCLQTLPSEGHPHGWAMGGVVDCAKASPVQLEAYLKFKRGGK